MISVKNVKNEQFSSILLTASVVFRLIHLSSEAIVSRLENVVFYF